MKMKLVKVTPDDLQLGENPRMILFESEEAEDIFVKQMKRAGPDHVETLEVFEINDKVFQLHSGYRRLHAAKILKWKFVPCRVLSLLGDKDAFYRAIATNYHRNNLSGYDLVMSIVKLQEKYEQTQENISKSLNIGQSYISQLLTVNNFPELLNYLKNNGHISKAISLSQIKKKIDRIAILGSIDAYSTAQLREIVKDAKHIEVIKPPLESITEASDDEIPIGGSMNTESREAGDYEGHASEDSPVHPIQTSGESEDDGEDELGESLVDTVNAPSPGGGPGKAEPEKLEDDAKSPVEVTPESSPSKFEKRVTCMGCFKPLKFGAKAIDKKSHNCKNAVEQLKIMCYQFPSMAVKDGKNGYRLRHNSMSIDEFQDGKATVEHAQNWLDNIHNAFINEIKFENAKKIGGN